MPPRCDNCGIACLVPEGAEGACRRFRNHGGQMIRIRDLRPGSAAPVRVPIDYPLVYATGAGAAYPDCKPAPISYPSRLTGWMW
jgi:hypothetical protein